MVYLIPKNYKSKASLKRRVLSLVLNTATDDDSLIYNGNLFHSLGPATEYALSPYVFSFATGSSSNLLREDLSWRRESLYLMSSLM